LPIEDAEESNPDAAKLARDGWWHDPEQSETLRAASTRRKVDGRVALESRIDWLAPPARIVAEW
jgi:hypothetical protein